MYSKSIKISTFVINTVLFIFLILAHFIPKPNAAIPQNYIIFVVPITIFFSFIMRSIDWRRKHQKGGFVWILGGLIAYASIFVGSFICGMLSEISYNDRMVFVFLYWIYIAIGCLICNLAIFVHQDEDDHFGTPPYDDRGFPNNLSP